MSSKDASAALNLIAEVIYIDCRDPDTIKDNILAWVAHLSANGELAGNKWDWPEVAAIVAIAAQELGLQLSIDNNFWFLKKI